MKTNQCPNLQAWSILSSPWNMEGKSFKHPKSPGKIILLPFSDLRNHASFSVWQQDVIWKSGNYLLPQQSTQKAGSWCTLQSTGSQISSAREETAQDTSDGSCCYSWGRKDSLKSSHMIKKKSAAAVIPNLVKLQWELHNMSIGTQEKTLTSEIGESLALNCSMLWKLNWSLLSVLVCICGRRGRNRELQ